MQGNISLHFSFSSSGNIPASGQPVAIFESAPHFLNDISHFVINSKLITVAFINLYSKMQACEISTKVLMRTLIFWLISTSLLPII